MTLNTLHPPTPPTIEEVAAAAGVSRSTVSRVVNGSSAVSESAREAVTRAIAQLRYVPNRAARSLASRQTRAIALIIPEDASQFFGDPFFAAVMTGINARLAPSDYILNLFLADHDPDGKLTRYLRGGNVDGALIVSHHTDDDAFIARVAESVPLVYGGRPMRPHAGEYFVDVDNVGGGRAATDYLLGRGHRRIATITGQLTMAAGIDRLQGYRQALADAGLPEGPVVDGRFTAAGGADAAREILAAPDAPDAVFVASELMVTGVLPVFAAAGLRVPEDIALVAFDDSPIATSVSPPLTTMRQPSYEMGEQMTDKLLQLLAGASPENATILQPELVVRDSA